ncbi:phosphatase PAP2 family protein [Burkholderia contaminans]|uniref:PAP2 family protein n=1 Tax=Burkholderia contaminans TaxID=488447 RepID=A0A6P2Y4M1_9BURK|nr:phosphatase PAP2 family protein [Burkholderia contaminans]VWD15166.1 PAP2 family protein [Burkholderia contaminans]
MKNRNAVVYVVAWVTIIAVAIIDFLWAKYIGLIIGAGWPYRYAGEMCTVFCFVIALICIATLQRYRKLTHALRCKEFASAIFCMITIIAWAQAMAITSYIGVGLNNVDIADTLVRFDSAIGFDWLGVYHWVSSHHILRIIFIYAYWSAFPQLILVPFFLAIVRELDNIIEFLVILFISSFVLLLIAIPFPAESAFLHFGITDPGTVSSVQDYVLLRSGAMPVINPYAVQGLVSMPSYHTMLAIFFAYSVRHVRFVFPAAVILNVVMIASTITVGGHYLADVLAGIACGFAVIWAVRLGLQRQFGKRGAAGYQAPSADAGGSSASAQ